MHNYLRAAVVAVTTVGIVAAVMFANCDIGGTLDPSATVEKTHLDSLREAYVAQKFGMFIHFNMSTYARCCCDNCVSVAGEWELGGEDNNLFAPHQLDCGQWARVAKSAGCKYMVLVSKHHGGFCLWPTAAQAKPHHVGASAWGIDTKRDVVREFVDSAAKYQLAVGVYFSIYDATNGNQLPYVLAQMTELLKNYGPMKCMWTDRWSWETGYDNPSYQPVYDSIKKLQPNCLLIENNRQMSLDHTDLMQYEYPVMGLVPSGNKIPGETNRPIRTDNCWFWHPVKNCELMSASEIVSDIKQVNHGNSTYLLDVTPDTSGLIPQCQVDRMTEVGTLLKQEGIVQ